MYGSTEASVSRMMCASFLTIIVRQMLTRAFVAVSGGGVTASKYRARLRERNQPRPDTTVGLVADDVSTEETRGTRTVRIDPVLSTCEACGCETLEFYAPRVVRGPRFSSGREVAWARNGWTGC